jgi:hypothetical protein
VEHRIDPVEDGLERVASQIELEQREAGAIAEHLQVALLELA